MSISNYPTPEKTMGGEDTRGVFRRLTTERRDTISRERLVERILAEFREMPCLRLTPAQAQRLFGVPDDVSARVIGQLVREGQLRIDPDGRYTAASIC